MVRFVMATMLLALSPVGARAEKMLAIVGSSAGLYISWDRGVTWEKNVGLGDTSIRAVAIERSSVTGLYAATSDALLISGDGGSSWSRGDFPDPAKIRRLISGGA